MLLLDVALIMTSCRLAHTIPRTHQRASSPVRVCSKNRLLSSISIEHACLLNDDSAHEPLSQIATRLSLPLLSTKELFECDHATVSHVLTTIPYECHNIKDYALAINIIDRSKRKPKLRMNPLHIDWCPAASTRLGQRLSKGASGTDRLLRAVSPRSMQIWDVTAGLGQDSLLLANKGATMVHMIERNPIVAALLNDALRRLHLLASSCDETHIRLTAARLSTSLMLTEGDGIEMLRDVQSDEEAFPDVVYLDPMFPERKKSASVKKNMQILHSLLGSTERPLDLRLAEEMALLQASLQATRRRVVVKRPIHALPLGQERGFATPSHLDLDIQPTYSVEGPVNRWDVYIKTS